jgi:dihydroorotase
MKTLIKNARILNPASQTDRTADVLLEGEFVSQISSSISVTNATVIHAEGKWLLPGLVDIHVHFREPGGEGIESIDSGSRAAAAGGITSVVCMPDTKPPVDNRTGIEFIHDRVALSGKARVYPTGCISNANEGTDLAPIGEMVEAGAVAITSANKGIMDAQLMRRAMEYSTIFHVPILTHPEDHVLSNGSLVNEGNMSICLGFIGSPNVAETVQISRDILLAQQTGARLHILQVSCADSVDIIRYYKSKGVKVTASVTPHHLVLTEDATEDYNTMAKVRPPLRTKDDQEALLQGIKDGTIDCIASGHMPCSSTGKIMNYMDAPFGISGLETLLPLTLGKIANRLDMTLLDIISLITTKPAKIMTLPAGVIEQGEPADLTLWNPEPTYTLNKDRFVSKSHNTPFHGMDMKGRVETTFLGGRVVYQYSTA